MRIAIVNDVQLAVESMRRLVQRRTSHEVAWVAHDGAEAVRMCAQDTPDLVLMDLVMPVLDGVEATRAIMSRSPCAVLIVTASIDRISGKVFDALGAGALDAVDTPVLGLSGEESGGDALLAKIETVARLLGIRPAQAPGRALIAMGSSAGGPAALAAILGDLPPDLPAGIAIVQHIDAAFVDGLVDWLAGHTRLKVAAAQGGETPCAGEVWVAATRDHMVITRRGTLDYVKEPREAVHRPSVDAFFNSVAQHWTGQVQAVLLTGMGRDGAAGLLALRERGHRTLAQDEKTSAIFGMPRAAIQLGAAREVLPLHDIAAALLAGLTYKPRSGDRA